MKVIIIPGLMGHPGEITFKELKSELEKLGHSVEIISWPNFPNDLPNYKITNTIGKVEELLAKEKENDFVILGHSMGGIIATILASKFKPKKLILVVSPYQAGTKDDLEGKYKEWKKVGHRTITSSVYGDLDIPFSFIEDAKKYNALDYIGKISCPKLFLIAGNDEKVTKEASEEFFNKASEPKKLEVIPGAQHRYQYQEGMIPLFNQKIIEFIES